MSTTQTVTESNPVIYFDSQKCLTAVTYVGTAIAAILTIGLLFYSIVTHAQMDKLVSHPAMAALTAERFFNILYIDLGCGVAAATAFFIKKFGQDGSFRSKSIVRSGVLGRR